MCTTQFNTTDALTERLFRGTIGALELFSIYLGKRLGLYRLLAGLPTVTAGELARAAEIHPRYAREWLEQQAVAGILNVANADDAAADRRYRLPSAHRGVLVDDEHEAHVAPLAQLVVGIAQTLPEVADAYRSGGGVEYSRYGADFRHGQGGINRPAFTTDLVRDWLPAIPEIGDRLARRQPVRIADVGCGQGWAAISMARAFPFADIVGIDVDEASIRDARRNARERGAELEWVHGDAGQLSDQRPFDLMLILEALHDMSRPVQVLTSLRERLADGGAVVIADERVAERFTAPGDEIERLMYGWSITHCLPAAMAEQPSAAIGTAIRPAVVAECAEQAGFASCEILPIDNELFRFYRLAG